MAIHSQSDIMIPQLPTALMFGTPAAEDTCRHMSVARGKWRSSVASGTERLY